MLAKVQLDSGKIRDVTFADQVSGEYFWDDERKGFFLRSMLDRPTHYLDGSAPSMSKFGGIKPVPAAADNYPSTLNCRPMPGLDQNLHTPFARKPREEGVKVKTIKVGKSKGPT